MAGYSGTALIQKLGVKEGDSIYTLGAPPHYRSLLKPLPAGLRFQSEPSIQTNIVHLFETDRDRLGKMLALLRGKLSAEAIVWVSWPKKASKVPTSITEDIIRELALPLGFVDVKVCAVTEVWSGLKLVVRKALR